MSRLFFSFPPAGDCTSFHGVYSCLQYGKMQVDTFVLFLSPTRAWCGKINMFKRHQHTNFLLIRWMEKHLINIKPLPQQQPQPPKDNYQKTKAESNLQFYFPCFYI